LRDAYQYLVAKMGHVLVLTFCRSRRGPIAANAVTLAFSWCIWSNSACCNCTATKTWGQGCGNI